MIFHEIYSVYYQTVAKILEVALDHPLKKDEICKIIEKYAFSESVLSIEPALREQKWQLIRSDGTTVLKNHPSMPLTTIQKRWLKSICQDPRIHLFQDDLKEIDFPEIEPLFTLDDFYIFDQYQDGDDYTDKVYITPKDIKDENKDLFPAAWAMYKNSANLDAENDKLDKEQAAEKIEQSYAASFGKAINPVLEPLGFDWKMGLSLVAGLAAKEVVISTLGTVYAVGGDDQNPAPLTDYLQNDSHFTPLIGLTMMLFILIYPPCLATLAVIKRETGSWKWVAFMFFYENTFAWIACFIFYNIGRALGF